MNRLPAAGILLLLFVLTLGAVLVAPLIGATPLDYRAVFLEGDPDSPDRIIFFSVRLPRVIFAAVAGGALALAGTLTQTILRNDLATPYTLGVAGGAAVGALLALRVMGLEGSAFVAGGALLGAFATVAVILACARALSSREGAATLVLIGVSLNLLAGSAILMIQYAADPMQAFQMIRWSMGAVDVVTWTPVALVGAALGAALVRAALWGASLNALAIGDEGAAALGVDPARVRFQALALAAIVTALVVAHAGPIGFVGLLVPHFLRRVFTGDHRFLVPASALAGAAFLVVCDAGARWFGGGLEVPVGLVTALIGGPVFLAVLIRQGLRAPG